MSMLAEIADKMPPVETFWKFFVVLGFVGVMLTVGLSLGRTWAGGLIVVGCACIGVLNVWPDTVMDRAILQELGANYLWQQRVAGFVPLVCTLSSWLVVIFVRRKTQSANDGGVKQAP